MSVAPVGAASSAGLLVTSGADGAFRVDRVAPGTYVVSAVNAGAPGAAASQLGVRVVVASNEEASADLKLSTGGDLNIAVLAAADRPVQMATAYVFPGSVSARTGQDLEEAYSNLQGGFTAMSFAPAGRATIKNVPGATDISVCAVAYPDGLERLSRDQMFLTIGKNIKSWPATCVAARTSGEPTQMVEITATLPPPIGTDAGAPPPRL